MMHNLTIFYADDDADDRALFKDIILSLDPGINIRTYNKGIDLINNVLNPPPQPDLIFLDLNMPGVSGFEVLQALKNSSSRNIPVVIFSTSCSRSNIKTCRAMGASYYIVKPNSYQAMKACLRKALTTNWDTFVVTDLSFVYPNKH